MRHRVRLATSESSSPRGRILRLPLPIVPLGTHCPTRRTALLSIRKPFPDWITVHLIPERRDRQRKRPTVISLP